MAEPRFRRAAFCRPRSVDLMGSAEIEPCLGHILKSDTFRKAPSLRQLLQYLVTQATAGGAEQIKESTIGIQVFGRREDFDSRIDKSVRVAVFLNADLRGNNQLADDLLSYAAGQKAILDSVQKARVTRWNAQNRHNADATWLDPAWRSPGTVSLRKSV